MVVNAEQLERIRAIELSMEEPSRPAFDNDEIEHLGILIRVTVEFHDFLRSAPSWPQFPGDSLDEMEYVIDSLLINIESFRKIVRSYGIVVGSTGSTVDWNTISARSLKDRYFSLYDTFVAESIFETKCRLLLDLVKLELVFAGIYYDRGE